MADMMCHLCYQRIPSYDFTTHMTAQHYQDQKQLTPLEMADLETVAAYSDIKTFHRAIVLFVTTLIVGSLLILGGALLGSFFPDHYFANGGDWSYTPTYAIAMMYVGGAWMIIGTAGTTWYLSWAMRESIWARYRAVQHRWTQLQSKEQ